MEKTDFLMATQIQDRAINWVGINKSGCGTL